MLTDISRSIIISFGDAADRQAFSLTCKEHAVSVANYYAHIKPKTGVFMVNQLSALRNNPQNIHLIHSKIRLSDKFIHFGYQYNVYQLTRHCGMDTIMRAKFTQINKRGCFEICSKPELTTSALKYHCYSDNIQWAIDTQGVWFLYHSGCMCRKLWTKLSSSRYYQYEPDFTHLLITCPKTYEQDLKYRKALENIETNVLKWNKQISNKRKMNMTGHWVI